MANNKNYISNKDKKRQEIEEEKRKQAYTSPSKTPWGKALIIFLVLAMAIGMPIVFIIYYCFVK